MPWMQTRSGLEFDFENPSVEQINFSDIAFALSHLNRFTGHVGAYSVAEHSVRVARQLPDSIKVYGLLHDAHEAYIGDIGTPTKQWLSGQSNFFKSAFDAMEMRVLRTIYEAARIDFPNKYIQGAVKFADVTALVTERRDMLGPSITRRSWGEFDSVKPLDEVYKPMERVEAQNRFLSLLTAFAPHLAH